MGREYPETHQEGIISLENYEDLGLQLMKSRAFLGDFGIQIAKDGRVWICINGVAFLRFKPIMKGRKL